MVYFQWQLLQKYVDHSHFNLLSSLLGNLTFVIPPEVADNTFEVSSPSGRVTVKKPLDREKINKFVITVYVTDSSNPTVTLFDVSLLIIDIEDVNDNAPTLQSGTCARISVPENGKTAVIHTLIAEDPDAGSNGYVLYAITGGNVGNKFLLDTKTGELTARPLDRESQSKYSLTVTAHDQGDPTLQSSCNLTVSVEDQNDNDPKFKQDMYSAAIFEDVPVDTSVLKVQATDEDIGVNSRIIYSLANESQWLFQIDNKTGVITTAG